MTGHDSHAMMWHVVRFCQLDAPLAFVT
eukprot:COSAG04_NODE_31409_length_257_cov_0.632911_1_plen_27_part_01